jgi:predicted nucleic acid-binding protein
MKHYLLDASAFMMLIKKATVPTTIQCLQDSAVLDLTFYEVGNAIWKESTLTKFLTPNEANVLEKVAQTIFARTDQIACDAGSFSGILEIAKSEKLSFYDSSYIFFAKEKGLKLVTEDKKLNMKAQKHVGVQTTIELISP